MNQEPIMADLRDALTLLAAQGEVPQICTRALDLDGELMQDYVRRNGALTSSIYCDDQPLVRYTNVGCSRFPVLLGLFGSRRRNRLYLDPMNKAPALSCGALLRSALTQPIVPRFAQATTSRRHLGRPDLLRELPALRLSPKDPAPSITLGLVYATNALGTQSNCSFHRICLWPDGGLTLWIAPNRHLDSLLQQALARGEELPISINIGLAPSVYLAACCTEPDIGFGGDELGVAGALHGVAIHTAPCASAPARYIDHAEIVIEGTLGRQTRAETHEGAGNVSIPEYLGYRREAGQARVMHVSGLSFRENALFQALSGPGKEQSEMLGISQEVTVIGLLERSGFTLVRDVYCCATGGGNLTVVIQVDKNSTSDDSLARAAACAVAESIACVKHVYLVDQDVNLFSQADVMWAMATRFRADTDLTLLGPLRGTSFDPTQHAEYTGSLVTDGIVKCVFDCSVPFAQRSRFARAFSISETWT